ncbi:MAG: hypothetical protein ABI790_17890, partial [Betaproteobacteria bacterium]
HVFRSAMAGRSEERPDLAPPGIQKIALNQSAEQAAEAVPPVQTRIVEAKPAQGVTIDSAKKQASAESDLGATSMQVKRKESVATEMRVAPPVTPLPPAERQAAGIAPAAPVHAPPPSAPAPAVASLAPAPFPAAETFAPARKEARADAAAASLERKTIEERVALGSAARNRDSIDAPAKPAAAAAASPSPAMVAPAAQGAVARAPVTKQLTPVPAPAAAESVPATAAADSLRANAQASAGARILGKVEAGLADKTAEDERPGPWMKRLHALREQGKLKELREELVRFRKAHPDVVLPKTLTELPAP